MWKVLLLTNVACLVVVSSDNSQATSFARSSGYGCIRRGRCARSCGQNEVYSSCTNGGCEARMCSQLGRPVRCVKLDPRYCKKGCVCASGYLRASNRKCVPKYQCDKTQACKPNEVYDVCPAPCPPQRCGVDPALVLCAPSPAPGDPACEPGCRCVDGYVRDADDECILRDNCPPECGPNEIPSNCSNGGCGFFKCSDLGNPIACVRPQECQKGCICQNTYLRNEKGACVPKDQCAGACDGDPNAKPGCGVNCGRTCATYKSKPQFCPLICKVNGCDCKEDFVFDSNLGKCVLEEDCTPTCGTNETYRPSGEKCVCKKEYARISNGKCVQKKR